MQIVWIVLAILFLWTCALTILFWNLYSHYNLILKGSSQKTLQGLLDALLHETENTKRDVAFLKKQCATIEQKGELHIQKVGLLRFNPFRDTGGDQSFIVSFVNAENSGIIISALYSRAGTRWYAKRVKEGKGVDYELSDEEKKALYESQIIKT